MFKLRLILLTHPFITASTIDKQIATFRNELKHNSVGVSREHKMKI